MAQVLRELRAELVLKLLMRAPPQRISAFLQRALATQKRNLETSSPFDLRQK
jgi:hypothetical protein